MRYDQSQVSLPHLLRICKLDSAKSSTKVPRQYTHYYDVKIIYVITSVHWWLFQQLSIQQQNGYSNSRPEEPR